MIRKLLKLSVLALTLSQTPMAFASNCSKCPACPACPGCPDCPDCPDCP